MAGPGREVRDVELVEADALGGDATSRPGTGGLATGRTRSGRLRAGGVVAAAVAALVALGGSVLADRHEDARLLSIAGRPGIVAPLDAPVTELWRGRGWIGSDLRDVGGRLVGVVSTPYAQVDVVSLDPRTGTDVWRTPVGPAAVTRLWTRCVVPGAPYRRLPAAARPVAVCVAVDDTGSTRQSAVGRLSYPTRARVVAVDAVDGTVLRDAPAPPSSQVAAIGTDAVLAHVAPDGRVRVVRADPRTGAERWSFTTPDAASADAFGQRDVSVQTAGDVIALDAGPTWVLSGDGGLLRSWGAPPPPGAGPPVDLLAAGGVLARTGVRTDQGWGTEVVDLDAGGSWTARGSPVRPRPDDGSLDDLVLLQAGAAQTVLAHDRTTGDLRWTRDLPYSVPIAVLDGRVVAADGDVVRAVDGRTGAPLWTARLDRPAQGAVVSDGRVVLVSAATDDGGVLTAVGLDDGRTRWTTDVRHALFLFAVDGRLYGWSARGLQALGAPAPPGPAGGG